MKPKYKAHYGKSQPVADDVMVEVVWTDTELMRGPAEFYNWRGFFSSTEKFTYRIFCYRILEDEQ